MPNPKPGAVYDRRQVSVSVETHDRLHLLKIATKKGFPALVADGLAALLKADPKLAAKVDAVRKAAA